MDGTTQLPEATPASANDDISDEELRAAIEDYRRHMSDPNRRRLTGKEIVEQCRAEGLFIDRPDITDSTEYVQELRRKSKRQYISE